MMTPERWGQIKTIFQAALERAPQQRAAYLSQACAGDEQLRQEVAKLLAADAESHLVDRPALAAAAEWLTPSALLVPCGVTAELPAGHGIGPYQILRLIGRGGMGEVYLAQDARLGRRLALKLLLKRFTHDPERLHRFRQEARAAMALNHPNIVTIFDIGQANERHFIATEFVAGQTLRAALQRARLAPVQALEIAIQIARALEAAHAMGIAHRDIKPENIMLRPDGYLKVLDFGLAKLTEPGSARSGAASEDTTFETRTGVLLGTISYMSPEQARGQRVDGRTDIFSLGVLLYELLTGQRPFAGATRHHVLVAILDQAPPPLAQHWPEAPAALQQIIERALAKDRGQRYQSASEFRADLQKLKRKLDVTARLQLPVGGNLALNNASTNLSTRSLRSKIVKVAALVAGSVLLTGLSFPLWQWLSQ